MALSSWQQAIAGGGGADEADVAVAQGAKPAPSIQSDGILYDQKERVKEASLTNDEIKRYSRHLLLKEIGVKGQKKIKAL